MIERLIFLSLFTVGLGVLFFIIAFVLIKLKALNYPMAIRLKQKLISFVLSAFIFGLLPLPVGFIVWTAVFFLLRYLVFKKDKYALNTIYRQFEGNLPIVSTPKQIIDAIKTKETREKPLREYGYSFLSYVDSTLVPVLFCCIGLAELNKTPLLLYIIGYFAMAICISLLLCKLFYKVFLNAPQSPSYLSPLGASIIVAALGLIYWFVAVFIFYTTVR